MPGVRIDVAWLPLLADGERIGVERASELVQALKAVIGPLINACEADLRSRLPYEITVRRSGVTVRYLAKQSFGDVACICIGTVYQTHTGDSIQNAVHFWRDGQVTWRRCYTSAQRRREGAG